MRLFIQPHRSKARVRRGGCGGGKRPAGPPAPRRSSCSPGSGSKPQPACGGPGWHRGSGILSMAQGGEPGSDGRERCLLQTGVQVRNSTASPKARLAPANAPRRLCKEPRHARGTAATRLGGGGTRSCQSPGPGPGRIAPLEGLPLPAAHGGGKPGVAGSSPPPAELRWLLLKLPPCSLRTGMLLPHHPPGFAPARSP